MQSEFKEVMHGLSHLSSSLPGHSACLALPAPSTPCRHGRSDKGHHMELERLRTEVALLRVSLSCLASCIVPTSIPFAHMTALHISGVCQSAATRLLCGLNVLCCMSWHSLHAWLYDGSHVLHRHSGRYSRTPAVVTKLQPR